MIEMTVGRKENGKVAIHVNANGTTNELIDELAAGAAHMVVMLADDVPAQDGLHESLARVVAGMMIESVCREMAAREAATDKPPEA